MEGKEGKELGCWCKPSPCHGDILIKLFKERQGLLINTPSGFAPLRLNGGGDTSPGEISQENDGDSRYDELELPHMDAIIDQLGVVCYDAPPFSPFLISSAHWSNSEEDNELESGDNSILPLFSPHVFAHTRAAGRGPAPGAVCGA